MIFGDVEDYDVDGVEFEVVCWDVEGDFCFVCLVEVWDIVVFCLMCSGLNCIVLMMSFCNCVCVEGDVCNELIKDVFFFVWLCGVGVGFWWFEIEYCVFVGSCIFGDEVLLSGSGGSFLWWVVVVDFLILFDVFDMVDLMWDEVCVICLCLVYEFLSEGDGLL